MKRDPGHVEPAAEQLVQQLMAPAAFDHPVQRIDLVETHISWLILAGDFVYKLKKPVVLDFLDFSDPDKRRRYCEAEIRLNKPFAPEIYLDVVPVTLDAGRARFGGDGEAVEYAVRMRRFDQSRRLDRQLADGKLAAADMEELGTAIAERHLASAAVEPARKARVLRLTREFMIDNLDALAGRIDDAVLDSLREWTLAALAQHDEYLAARFDHGFVRDCHGDLHLGNLVRLDSGIAAFDCIEFSDDLRQIDVMADIGFLVMDLAERGRRDLAAWFLNRYLELTGDYRGVTVLRLFVVYRCLVRAKVAAIRAGERAGMQGADDDIAEAHAYAGLAEGEARAIAPSLVLMHGFSGSGKTRVSGELMAALPAIRLRSDIERKRLFDLAETASSKSDVEQGIYSGSADERVYTRLFQLAGEILDSRHSVILDATFLDARRREEALSIAESAGCRAFIVDVRAPEAVLRERLAKRAHSNAEASEANVPVLEHQLATADKLSDAERAITVTCDNGVSTDFVESVGIIREVIAGS